MLLLLDSLKLHSDYNLDTENDHSDLQLALEEKDDYIHRECVPRNPGSHDIPLRFFWYLLRNFHSGMTVLEV